MNYIITNNKSFFENIGDYNYCKLEDMVLPDVIAFDSETTSLSPREGHMFCVQIGTGENNYIIDFQQLGGELTFEELAPYLKGKALVGHNLTFDLGWLYKHNFIPEKVYDTFIASKILYNGNGRVSRHSFGFVMDRELGIEYDKSEQKNIAKTQLSNHKAIQYAFNDVDKVLELVKELGRKLKEAGSVETFKLHCRYIKALAYMEQCGMPVSVGRWQEKIEKDKVILKELSDEVVNYIYDNLPKFRDNQIDMFDSSKRIIPMLTSQLQMIPVFEAFGIELRDADDHPDKRTLNKEVLRKSNHPFVEIWLRYKQAEHDVSTYGENILGKIDDGRIYTDFNPVLDTARISTRKGGVNILNFPANQRTRECFVAKKGHKMVVADYEGQENVVGADLHQDAVMIASIKNGDDLHSAFARMIFPELEKLTDNEIKNNHKDKRQFSKAPRFCFSYGGTGFTAAKSLNIPVEEGEKLEKLYRELHPGVYEWGEQKLSEAMSLGYIESADGFKLALPFYDEFEELHQWMESKNSEFWVKYKEGKEQAKLRAEAEEKGEEFRVTNAPSLTHYDKVRPKLSKYFSRRGKYFRLSLNNPVQATSAHMTKRAACLLFDYIIDNGHFRKVKICNIPHDEMVLEVREDLAEEYKKVLEQCMVEGGNHYLTSGLVEIKAEACIGDSWYEAK
jgi:DNA polymerase-1